VLRRAAQTPSAEEVCSDSQRREGLLRLPVLRRPCLSNAKRREKIEDMSLARLSVLHLRATYHLVVYSKQFADNRCEV